MQIKKFIQKLNSYDKYFSLPISFSFLCALTLTILFLILQSQLPNKLPLFYSRQWGDSQLISKQAFLILPAGLIVITVVNIALTLQIHHTQTILRRILLLTIVCVDVIILITSLKILSIFLL